MGNRSPPPPVFTNSNTDYGQIKWAPGLLPTVFKETHLSERRYNFLLSWHSRTHVSKDRVLQKIPLFALIYHVSFVFLIASRSHLKKNAKAQVLGWEWRGQLKPFVVIRQGANIFRGGREVMCVVAQSLRHVWLFVTPWTVTSQTPLCPLDSPGRNSEVGCHALLQGIFPTQNLLDPPALAGGFFTTEPLGSPGEAAGTMNKHKVVSWLRED